MRHPLANIDRIGGGNADIRLATAFQSPVLATRIATRKGTLSMYHRGGPLTSLREEGARPSEGCGRAAGPAQPCSDRLSRLARRARNSPYPSPPAAACPLARSR